VYVAAEITSQLVNLIVGSLSRDKICLRSPLLRLHLSILGHAMFMRFPRTCPEMHHSYHIRVRSCAFIREIRNLSRRRRWGSRVKRLVDAILQMRCTCAPHRTMSHVCHIVTHAALFLWCSRVDAMIHEPFPATPIFEL